MSVEELRKYRVKAVARHYQKNLDAKRFYCELCDKNFRSRSTLTKHNETNKHRLRELLHK